jgi:CRP-like cAMP-binding protein
LSGTTLYTVSRTLSQWQQRGVLRSQGRRLVILKPSVLATLARTDRP